MSTGTGIGTPPRFKYEVSSRLAGNYAELAGQWVLHYMGCDPHEALDEARANARFSREVRVLVSVKGVEA